MNRLVYCGNIMEREKASVQPTDLNDALKFFKEKTGTDAQMIEVNEKIFSVLRDFMPERIKLLPHGGVMTYEIWLSSHQEGKKEFSEVVFPATTKVETPQNQNPSPVIPTPPPRRPIKIVTGVKIPTKKMINQVPLVQKDLFGKVLLKVRIMELAGSGSSRKIAERLHHEGYKVSHMTVSRRLKKE